MKTTSLDLLAEKVRGALQNAPEYGTVSFVAHFKNGRLSRVELGTVKSMLEGADNERKAPHDRV